VPSGLGGNVLELVGDGVEPFGEAGQDVQIVEAADDEFGQFLDGGLGGGVEEAEAEPSG
jgi:hypothetical protein